MMSLWTLLIEQLNTQHQQQCLAALKSCFILILVLETGVPKIMTDKLTEKKHFNC